MDDSWGAGRRWDAALHSCLVAFRQSAGTAISTIPSSYMRYALIAGLHPGKASSCHRSISIGELVRHVRQAVLQCDLSCVCA